MSDQVVVASEQLRIYTSSPIDMLIKYQNGDLIYMHKDYIIYREKQIDNALSSCHLDDKAGMPDSLPQAA